MNTDQKPTLILVIAGTTLISGVVNLFWGGMASLTAIGTVIGIVCLPFTILPTILGIFEIIYAAKLLNTPPQPMNPFSNIAVFEILCFFTGNLFAMAVGILSLIFYNDLTVKDYFARINATQPSPPTPPAPVPALPIDPTPQPPAPPEPAEPESPPKPKRGRKVA